MNCKILLFLCITISVFPQEGKWLPFDESNQDTAFSRVFTLLHTAVAGRDINLLKEILSDSLYINEEGAGILVPKRKFLSF